MDMQPTQCAGLMPNGTTCPWSARSCKSHTLPLPVDAVVYYVGNPDTQLVKIGTTTRLRRRMATLTCWRPNLVLLATEPGTYPLETRRKRQFRLLNEPLPNGETEWFRKAPVLMEHIGDVRLKHGILCPGGSEPYGWQVAPLRA